MIFGLPKFFGKTPAWLPKFFGKTPAWLPKFFGKTPENLLPLVELFYFQKSFARCGNLNWK